MADEDQQNPVSNDEASQAQFGVQRIYLKDLSFESPGEIDSNAQWQPQVSQDLNTQVSKIDDTNFEVVLKLTVTVKLGEKTAFLVEVHQAGVFLVSGIEGPQLQHALTAMAPQILFPYAREAVDNMAVRGGFPAINLPPINFDFLFAKAMEEAKAKGAEAEPMSH